MMEGYAPEQKLVEQPRVIVQDPTEHEQPARTFKQDSDSVRAEIRQKTEYADLQSRAYKENEKLDRDKEAQERREAREARRQAREEKFNKIKEDAGKAWESFRVDVKSAPKLTELAAIHFAKEFRNRAEDACDKIADNAEAAKQGVEKWGLRMASKIEAKYTQMMADMAERRDIANKKIENRELKRASETLAETSKRQYERYQKQLERAMKQMEKAKALGVVFEETNETTAYCHKISSEATKHLEKAIEKRNQKKAEAKG